MTTCWEITLCPPPPPTPQFFRACYGPVSMCAMNYTLRIVYDDKNMCVFLTYGLKGRPHSRELSGNIINRITWRVWECADTENHDIVTRPPPKHLTLAGGHWVRIPVPDPKQSEFLEAELVFFFFLNIYIFFFFVQTTNCIRQPRQLCLTRTACFNLKWI